MGSYRFWHQLAQSRGAAAVAFAWGLAEATLFFIVPDVWIGFLALFDWRAGARAVAWAVLGAVIGGGMVYAAGARLDAAESARILLAVPAISPATIRGVDEEMRERGVASMVEGPLRGTPYKIYARTAGVQGQSPVAFLLWSIPARGVRFLLVAGVAALYGTLARRFTTRTDWLIAPYFLVWTLFYAAYFRTFGF